jgi:LacI family transcriptional regulator
MLFTGLDWEEAESNVSQYTDGRCDGLILIAARKQSKVLDMLMERDIRYVLIGTSLPGTHSVDVDNELGARLAAEHLLSLGHRHIAMIQGSENQTSNDERTRGFVEASFGRAEVVLEPGAYQMERGFEATVRALSRDPRPTALFCANDLIAQSALQAAAELGISVPQELSIIGFDDYSFAASTSPPLTTIRQPLRQIGSLAAERLLESVQDASLGTENVRLEPCLIVRESTSAL